MCKHSDTLKHACKEQVCALVQESISAMNALCVLTSLSERGLCEGLTAPVCIPTHAVAPGPQARTQNVSCVFTNWCVPLLNLGWMTVGS